MQYLMSGFTRVFACVTALLVAFAVHAEIPAPVASRLAAAGLPEDSLGFVVLDAATGKEVLAHRPGASMQPASTLKVHGGRRPERLGPGLDRAHRNW
ncbi:MAG: hypothetical protein IPJ28_07425 [Betaproteobacteria bacterium]|nr:hypothetical protein [Betaproteobacteria bacterium]